MTITSYIYNVQSRIRPNSIVTLKMLESSFVTCSRLSVSGTARSESGRARAGSGREKARSSLILLVARRPPAFPIVLELRTWNTLHRHILFIKNAFFMKCAVNVLEHDPLVI